MSALNRATLPARFKGKEASFTAARNDLEKAVVELGTVASSNDLGKIKIAIERMHNRYVTLAAILESSQMGKGVTVSK